jgi:hypothetical protein
MRVLIALIALGAALAGCAGMFTETPYADAVQVARLDGTTLRVTGEVNDVTSDARVQDYLLLRAAEETLAAGYGHFRVLERDEKTYVPEETSTTYLPGSTLVVRMYKGPMPPDATGNIYDAAELVRFVGSRVRAMQRSDAGGSPGGGVKPNGNKPFLSGQV